MTVLTRLCLDSPFHVHRLFVPRLFDAFKPIVAFRRPQDQTDKVHVIAVRTIENHVRKFLKSQRSDIVMNNCEVIRC